MAIKHCLVLHRTQQGYTALLTAKCSGPSMVLAEVRARQTNYGTQNQHQRVPYGEAADKGENDLAAHVQTRPGHEHSQYPCLWRT